jgi:glycosyltransferase involved in cell wall biosynthesis
VPRIDPPPRRPLERDDIIVVNDDVWNAPERVRHKMARAWARAGNRVLWLEQTPFPAHFRRGDARLATSLRPTLRRIEKRLWVGTMPPAFPRMLKGGAAGRALLALHRPLDRWFITKYRRQIGIRRADLLVLFQQPSRHDLLAVVPHARSVYYCNDIVGYGRGEPGEMAEEIACCRGVDHVFTTSAVVAERLARENPRTRHFPHAVDRAWWDANKDRTPPECERIPAPRLVYTGVCGERLDFELVEALARELPGWSLVFVGPPLQTAERIAALAARCPNVHFVGGRPVEDLAGWIASADALMFPYVLDELQRNVGLPIKFFEYAVSGHPILATPFTTFDGVPPGAVLLAGTAGEWSARLAEATAPDARDRLRALLVPLAEANTYEHRVEEMRAELAGGDSGE